MRLLRIACLIGAALPTLAQAQVVNGDFANGPASWTWEDAAEDIPTHCLNAAQPVTASTTVHTPNAGTLPAAGRVASMVPFPPYRSGTWFLCRKIHQTVVIPPGTRLRFDAKLGDTYSSQQMVFVNDVELQLVVDGDALLSDGLDRGLHAESEPNTCVNYGHPCPKFESYDVDISKYWGRTLAVEFRAWSRHSASATATTAITSPAFLDNIAFEAVEPGKPYLGNIQVNGPHHTVVWYETPHSDSFKLEQRRDGGPWTVVFQGAGLSWTSSDAPSGQYSYRVQACGVSCGDYSDEKGIFIDQQTPSGPVATPVGRSYTVTWGVSPAALRYVLERRVEGGTWEVAYDGPETQFTSFNTAPGVYGHRVKACGSSLCSAYSAEAMLTAVDVAPVIIQHVTR